MRYLTCQMMILPPGGEEPVAGATFVLSIAVFAQFIYSDVKLNSDSLINLVLIKVAELE